MAKKTPSNQYDLMVAESNNRTFRFQQGCAVIISFFKYTAVVTFLIIILLSVRCVMEHPSERIRALAALATDLRLETWMAYIVAGGGIGYGVMKHRRSGRLIGKVSDFRQEKERRDPVRTSSGLTRTGDTPKQE